MAGRIRHLGIISLATVMLLSGCADGPSLPRLSDLNPFAEKEVPLPGKRVPVALTENKAGLQVAAADKPITLPAPRQNDSGPSQGAPPAIRPGTFRLAVRCGRLGALMPAPARAISGA